jgi:hypothetical protein
MDLPPVIGDMANNMQIANYSGLAHDKLREAQSIMQTALDTHMLLSHYDFYKKFSDNVGESLNSMKNDISSAISSGASGDQSFNPFDAWEYAQGKYKDAVKAYNQVKDLKNVAQEKYQQGKTFVNDSINKAKAKGDELLEEANTTKNTAIKKVGNKVKEIELDAKGKIKQAETTIKDETNNVIGKTKKTFNDTASDIKANLKPSSDFFEDPSKMPTQLFTDEELSGEAMKTPFLNKYYATKLNGDGFPDDIFADTEGPKIKSYAETYAKSARKVKKTKTTKVKKEEPEESKVSEEANLKPSDAIKKLEAQKVQMTPESSLPKPKQDIESEETTPAEEPVKKPVNNFDDIETPDLQKEYEVLQNSARSEGAEQRFQDMGEELSNRVLQGLDRPINTNPISDTVSMVQNEADKLAQTGQEALQRPLTVAQKMSQQTIQQAEDNVRQGINNFTNTVSSTADDFNNTVNDIKNQVKSGVEDGLQKAKQALGLDTEESVGGDEDPVGLAITAVLGLADLGTQIASFFEKPKTEVLSAPAQQVGV